MSMFNLEESIANWRRQMAAEGIESASLLDEFESHLRDVIEQQVRSGADLAEAFEAAVGSLGKPAQLKAEFAKLSQPRVLPKRLLQIFYFGATLFLLVVNSYTLLAFEISPVVQVVGFSSLSVVSLYLFCLPFLLKALPNPAYLGLLKVLKTAMALVWIWPLFVILHAGRANNSEVGHVTNLVGWCVCAAIGLSGLALALRIRVRGNGDFPAPPFQPLGQPIPPTRPVPPEVGFPLAPKPAFAPLAHEALRAASHEAQRLGHDFIGTEHLLLGLLISGKAALWKELHLEGAKVRQEIERVVCPVPTTYPTGTQLRFTPRACGSLKLAAKEARRMKQPAIGPEHIFLGLLIEGSGVAAKVLEGFGMRIAESRRQILSLCRVI